MREARLHSLPLSKFSTINRVTLSKDNSMVPHVPRFSLADVMRLFFLGCKVVGHGPTFVKLQVLRCGRCALNNTREGNRTHWLQRRHAVTHEACAKGVGLPLAPAKHEVWQEQYRAQQKS